MYNIGTVTTTANSPKITGTGTRWKDNTTLVSVGQVVLIENGSNLLINSIYSVESNTALTLAFPVSAKLTNAKYIILTTMIDSISDGVNKATAQVIASEVYTEILNQWMTAQGTIDVELPTGQKIKLRTVAEMDKQLDGKLDKTGGELSNTIKVKKSGSAIQVQRTGVESSYIEFLDTDGTRRALIGYGNSGDDLTISNSKSGGVVRVTGDGKITINNIEAMKMGDYGWGGRGQVYTITTEELDAIIKSTTSASQIFRFEGQHACAFRSSPTILLGTGGTFGTLSIDHNSGNVKVTGGTATTALKENSLYGTANTTKDSNGNLKAASPIVKLFANDIELNEESEGVEMEHLGIGHYLIKGVVGFNADGAWGINNGFVIPQDHNGKNMVLIDYEVRPDGDIEVFVFHQQNADMPERFQNKRIKHFDEEGVPVYFQNYEPCDVPESRWIDMRVEMPPNSLYNQKQAEAERLAKLEAERLAQEEAKRAAEEAERAEQEAAEREQYGLDENSVLL
ncbi:hypothetical protein ACON3F_04650 [Providencia hangzhouensis]|uniref:phage tail fiber protein n=1 Tax=Providencia TaxID=586 RepID=UPI002349674E|nr:hypothetical protein [Providencia sp. PROV099]WOB96923.1 hypothetical protein P3L54_09005 [Providencia sp. PROV099]